MHEVITEKMKRAKDDDTKEITLSLNFNGCIPLVIFLLKGKNT
jgi:hypothetical protein